MTGKGDILKSNVVAVSPGNAGYPSSSPYSPGAAYPEYPFGFDALSDDCNSAYESVRSALQLLDLDPKHYGRNDWNPLGEIIRPGDTVVLKPNLIRDFRETSPSHGDCLITHGSIIRAALDYVYIALKGEGRIIIADAPQNDADFDSIRRIAGLDAIQDFYRRHAGLDVEVFDLRPEKAKKVDGVIVSHEKLPGDPAGYVKVNLGRRSAFGDISHLCHLLYGAEYDTGELRSHHHDDVHEYLISKTIMDADCVINLPKLKTHKKTGITASMKNLVGINGNKNWLPHHREGTPAQGGDQFSDNSIRHRMEMKTMTCFRNLFPKLGPLRGTIAGPLKALGKGIFGDTNTNTVRSGNWYGNDTTWRMVIDLNRILLYADQRGHIREEPVRQMFCIVDGIVGGEGNGPLDTTPKPMGLVVAGMNAVAVDLVCAHAMGFDYRLMPVLARALAEHDLPILLRERREVICRSTDPTFDGLLEELKSAGDAFKPHFGWKGHIELDNVQAPEKRTERCAL